MRDCRLGANLHSEEPWRSWVVSRAEHENRPSLSSPANVHRILRQNDQVLPIVAFEIDSLR